MLVLIPYGDLERVECEKRTRIGGSFGLLRDENRCDTFRLVDAWIKVEFERKVICCGIRGVGLVLVEMKGLCGVTKTTR